MEPRTNEWQTHVCMYIHTLLCGSGVEYNMMASACLTSNYIQDRQPCDKHDAILEKRTIKTDIHHVVGVYIAD